MISMSLKRMCVLNLDGRRPGPTRPRTAARCIGPPTPAPPARRFEILWPRQEELETFGERFGIGSSRPTRRAGARRSPAGRRSASPPTARRTASLRGPRCRMPRAVRAGSDSSERWRAPEQRDVFAVAEKMHRTGQIRLCARSRSAARWPRYSGASQPSMSPDTSSVASTPRARSSATASTSRSSPFSGMICPTKITRPGDLAAVRARRARRHVLNRLDLFRRDAVGSSSRRVNPELTRTDRRAD